MPGGEGFQNANHPPMRSTERGKAGPAAPTGMTTGGLSTPYRSLNCLGLALIGLRPMTVLPTPIR